MKYLDEYRDASGARQLAREIARTATRPWTLMEVCGGQTHSIIKFGLDELLPPSLLLIHGPGCPVCVTPLELIEKAQAIARRPGVIFCSFGDMLRVPGSRTDLLTIRAQGADVRTVYSPLDAVKLATENPHRQVVFFAVGFETTAPTTAMAAYQARLKGLSNFSLLVSHVLVPPVMEAVLNAPDCRVKGFLAAGHVCAVTGAESYEPMAAKYRVPIVVTGFEPLDILLGVLMCIRQLESGRAEVENQYRRAVRFSGNAVARDLLGRVFETVPRKWRGIGVIAGSGLALREEYAEFDSETRFDVASMIVEEPLECLSGRVLQGLIKPPQCPSFGIRCTPEHPFGAPMVSSEGACAAYFRYRGQAPP